MNTGTTPQSTPPFPKITWQMIVGIAVFAAAFPALWVNELATIRSLAPYEQGILKAVSVISESIDPANEGKLIHVFGELRSNDVLRDPVFGVSVKEMRYTRNVEMYQWIQEVSPDPEHPEKKRYTYLKKWSAFPIPSRKFKNPAGHRNPPMPYVRYSQTAENINLGAFVIQSAMIKKFLSVSEPLRLAAPIVTKIGAITGKKATLNNQSVYLGENPEKPAVGDMRIKFIVTRPQVVTVVGKQAGNTVVPYATSKDMEIQLLVPGQVSMKRMFGAETISNQKKSWFYRLVGFLMLWGGLAMICEQLIAFIPFFPSLRVIPKHGIAVIAALTAVPFGMLTLAIVSIAYSPLAAIMQILFGGIIITILYVMVKSSAIEADR